MCYNDNLGDSQQATKDPACASTSSVPPYLQRGVGGGFHPDQLCLWRDGRLQCRDVGEVHKVKRDARCSLHDAAGVAQRKTPVSTDSTPLP